MNCEQLKQNFALNCTHVSDDVAYLETNLALPFYGAMVGGYVQNIGRGRVRISDNADTLFEAMTLGVRLSAQKAQAAEKLAKQFGVEISESGEIFVACDEADSAYFFSRYIEAAYTIGSATLDWHPKVATAFEKKVAKVLSGHFKASIKRSYQIEGASGHQLKFHFAVYPESSRMALVQTISAVDGNPNWAAVYGTSGKMIDVKNANPSTRRLVVLEPSEATEMKRAKIVLQESADVLIYESPAALIAKLDAAA